MDQNWKQLVDKLPAQPCGDLQHDVLSGVYDGESDLGEGLLLFNREPVEILEDIKQTMFPEDWARRDKTAKHRWGARCTCSLCGDDFIAGYHKDGILLAEGDDGVYYDGYVEEGPGVTSFSEGEVVYCPHCWTSVNLTRRKDLRNGRTYQVQQAEVVNVEQYTAVMFWLVSRHIDDMGCDTTMFYPHAALVIDTEGKLRRFRAKRFGREVRDVEWLPCTRTKDPMQTPYYSWDAVNERKIGGWTFTYGPDMEGHTGEKTALDRYIGKGGCWPGAYLHVWQKHPQIENLMRQGFAFAVADEIDRRLANAAYWRDLCDAPPISWVDWSEVKPHKMLHMSKTAFREIKKKCWTAEDASCWDRYWRQIDWADALEYETCRAAIGAKAVGQLLEMIAAGWSEFAPVRVVRYLEKQDMLEDGVQHLIDYRRMMYEIGIAETEETCWPRDLIAAHDRIVQSWAEREKMEYQMGFTSAYMLYKNLEWTDGDLCVVLPKVEADLVAEGNTLRHCVGGYGKSHCTGKPVFFIRHYRRPERSYYTLQIDMKGSLPKEIQLHGYGNERHGEHKQYKHSIPQKVREFCDRWEREVLTPWFDENKRKAAKTPLAENKKEGHVA